MSTWPTPMSGEVTSRQSDGGDVPVNPLNRSIDTETASAVDEPGARDEGSLELLATLGRRKWIVICSVIVAMVLAVLYLAKTDPTYEAEATVLVKERDRDNPIASDRTAGRSIDRVEDHMRIVRSSEILEAAAAKLQGADLPGLPTKGGIRKLIEELRANLATTREENSQMFAIAFQGPDPETCAVVVSQIVRAYQGWVDKEYRTSTRQTLDQLAKDVNDVEKELERTRQQMADVQDDPDMLVFKDTDGRLVILDEVQKLQDELVLEEVRRAEAEQFLREVKLAVDQRLRLDTYLAGPDPSAAPTSLVGGAADYLARQSEFLALKLEQLRLSRELGSRHPRMRELQDRMTILQAARRAGGDAATSQPGGETEELMYDMLADWLVNSSEERVRQRNAVVARLTEDLRGKKEEARQRIRKQNELIALQAKIDRYVQRASELNGRIEDLQLTGDENFLAIVEIEPAIAPERPISPNVPRTLVLALVAGLVVGFALTWLAETFDRSFRSPDDVRAALNLPVLGNVPLIDRPGRPGPARGEIWLTTVDTPHSMETEAFRALRTVIGVAAAARQHKSLLFTSPAAGDGKTTIACNMAVAAAQLGARVLLLDADMRQPSVHRVFACANRRGLSTFLENKATEWRVLAVSAADVPNLDLLPAGPVTHVPAELLGSERFGQLIAEAKADYDYVICDSPPVMPVTDPCVIAGVVDATVLVVKAGRNERAAAQAAKSALDGVHAEMLGVVMNDVSVKTKYGYIYYRHQQYGDGDRKGYSLRPGVPPDGDNGDGIVQQQSEPSETGQPG